MKLHVFGRFVFSDSAASSQTQDGQWASEHGDFQLIQKRAVHCQQWLQVPAEEIKGTMEDSKVIQKFMWLGAKILAYSNF